MKFFFPDSHDLVDPSFDFETETRSEHRVRHRNDQYAHELFDDPPYSGVLISKAIVDGTEKGSGKYTVAQRHRLLRQGVREFFRLGDRPLDSMGDCGAFSYLREKYPPYSVEEVINFYLDCQVDYGVSVDHVILAFQSKDTDATESGKASLARFRERQMITLDLADDFLTAHKRQKLPFTPLGVAQGWSARSYAAAVRALQKIGYSYIGIGGLVPLQSTDILAILNAVNRVRRAKTRLHLFGVNRCEHLDKFEDYGVISFDSTSPLLQAFKHDKHNYYTDSYKYSAIRVPQVEGNFKFGNRIRAGEVNQEEARKLEVACLKALKRFDEKGGSIPRLLNLLREYDMIHDGRKDRSEDYGKTLEDRPWKTCACRICRKLGIHVVIFRGAERNRRRGFHNLYVTYHRFTKGTWSQAFKSA